MSLFPIKYTCDSCGKIPRNPDTMLCVCGGEFRADINIGVPATTFEPHFCPTIRQHVTSWKDQEKKAKAFRSPDHPEGFVLLQDNKKYIKQLKQTHKHREDIIADTYKKDGIKYPKGKQVNFDETKGRFIDRTSKEPISNKRYSLPSKPLRVSEKVKVAAVFIGAMFLASSVFAEQNKNDTSWTSQDHYRLINIQKNLDEMGKTISNISEILNKLDKNEKSKDIFYN